MSDMLLANETVRPALEAGSTPSQAYVTSVHQRHRRSAVGRRREAEALAVAAQFWPRFGIRNAYQIRAVAYEQLEQWDEAKKAWLDCLRVTPGFLVAQVRLGYIAGRTGDRTEATRVLRALEARVNKDDHSGGQGDLAQNLAAVHMGLGNRAQALTWLERAVAAHSGSMLYLAVDRTYRPLHNEPRFRALLEKVGLPTS
jgi:tetratricopeptide (TPR) repeat protein